MDNVSGTFTLSFENPFWIGVFEIECGKNYEVARVVFGPEPTDVQLSLFRPRHKLTYDYLSSLLYLHICC